MLGWFFLFGYSLCPGCDLAAPSPRWLLPRGMSRSSLPRTQHTESTSLLFHGMTCQDRGRARRRLVSGMEPLGSMLRPAWRLTIASPVYLASTGRLPGTVGKCWHCLSVPVCAPRRNKTSQHCAGYHSYFHSSRTRHPKTALELPTFCAHTRHTAMPWVTQAEPTQETTRTRVLNAVPGQRGVAHTNRGTSATAGTLQCTCSCQQCGQGCPHNPSNGHMGCLLQEQHAEKPKLCHPITHTGHRAPHKYNTLPTPVSPSYLSLGLVPFPAPHVQ